jgi:hypothetical protein
LNEPVWGFDPEYKWWRVALDYFQHFRHQQLNQCNHYIATKLTVEKDECSHFSASQRLYFVSALLNLAIFCDDDPFSPADLR